MKLKWTRTTTYTATLFVILRIVYLLAGVPARAADPPGFVLDASAFRAAIAVLRPGALSSTFINPWMRWDTGWYLKIAALGYGAHDNSTVFMPLYPLAIRFLGTALGGDYLLAALAISNLASVAILGLLYQVALDEGLARPAAFRALVTFFLFPTAFFLFAGYTEALFLALLLGAWVFARRMKWVAAGLLGALATLTRIQGVILCPVLLWMFLVERSEVAQVGAIEQVRRTLAALKTRAGWGRLAHGSRLRDWLGLFMPLLAFAGYNLWLRTQGMTSVVGGLESGWSNPTVMPWTGFWLFLRRLVSYQMGIVDLVDLAALGLALGLSLYGLVRLDPALSLYNWLTLALIMMGGSTPHLLDSFTRYFLALFPAFLLMGQSPSRALRWTGWGLSLCAQLFFLLAFLNWLWVG